MTKAEKEKILKQEEGRAECDFPGSEECEKCVEICPRNQIDDHDPVIRKDA